MNTTTEPTTITLGTALRRIRKNYPAAALSKTSGRQEWYAFHDGQMLHAWELEGHLRRHGVLAEDERLVLPGDAVPPALEREHEAATAPEAAALPEVPTVPEAAPPLDADAEVTLLCELGIEATLPEERFRALVARCTPTEIEGLADTAAALTAERVAGARAEARADARAEEAYMEAYAQTYEAAYDEAYEEAYDALIERLTGKAPVPQ